MVLWCVVRVLWGTILVGVRTMFRPQEKWKASRSSPVNAFRSNTCRHKAQCHCVERYDPIPEPVAHM